MATFGHSGTQHFWSAALVGAIQVFVSLTRDLEESLLIALALKWIWMSKVLILVFFYFTVGYFSSVIVF